MAGGRRSNDSGDNKQQQNNRETRLHDTSCFAPDTGQIWDIVDVSASETGGSLARPGVPGAGLLFFFSSLACCQADQVAPRRRGPESTHDECNASSYMPGPSLSSRLTMPASRQSCPQMSSGVRRICLGPPGPSRGWRIRRHEINIYKSRVQAF